MMSFERSEIAQDNFVKFIYELQPKTKRLFRELEKILMKLYSKKMGLYYLIKYG